ncbi:MAG: molybdate ABC transporter substrate-binding protein [Candidatus Hydrogenedentes bacterium]|nr:molybdate ABC transporter substrate-binding protein [Candidatus Hydrogenedentota bacterium]
MRTLLALACCALVFAGVALCDDEHGTVRVAVASNFITTQEALVKKFAESSGHTVTSSAGSTGKLFAQISNGAPFDIFLSADEEHVAVLEKRGLAAKGSRFTYAIGRLAVYSPVVAGIANGAEALKAAQITHLAIANPETAPYGEAAVAALRNLDLWDHFQGRIVYGENIAQTMQFVDSGGAEAGVVAYSQVHLREKKLYWIVPGKAHPPLNQDAALLEAGTKNTAAAAYCAFLKSEDARRIIAESGYSAPAR